MPKSYSQDLRERVVRAVEAGTSCHEAAAIFEVSPSSAIKRLARWWRPNRARPSRWVASARRWMRTRNGAGIDGRRAGPDAGRNSQQTETAWDSGERDLGVAVL